MFGGRSPFQQGESAAAAVSLNMTALMDILSNLLFFLLASYTSQDIEAQQQKQLQLPASTSETNVVLSLRVSVSQEEIAVADVPVQGLAIEGDRVSGAVDGRGNLVALYDRLSSIRSARDAAGQGGLPGSDTILLLADKRIDSGIVTSVLKTAGSAGFPNVRFGVIAK